MNNRVCQILGIEKPIIQAPMAWITSAEMVANVSNAGGLGILGSCAGFKNIITSVDGTIEEMRKTVRKTKELTNKPFGMNVSPKIDDPQGFSRATIKLCKEEGIKILSLVGSLDPESIRELKKEGFTIIFRQANPTIKDSIEAEKAGVDIICITGCDNGGWIPTSHSNGTLAMIPLITKVVKIPVIASGGIVDEHTVRAAFNVGAEGVYVGTRFMLSKECVLHDSVKQKILNISSDDLIVVTNINGLAKWRLLPNKLAKDALEENKKGNVNPNVGSYYYSFVKGDLEKGVISMNGSVSLITSIESCKDIVDELAKGLK